MKKLTMFLITVPMAMFSAAALAGDAAAGAKKAEVCLDCHVPAEDFAGMSAEEISGAVKGVLGGEVKHPGVDADPADADDIAAYFAAEAAGQ